MKFSLNEKIIYMYIYMVDLKIIHIFPLNFALASLLYTHT